MRKFVFVMLICFAACAHKIPISERNTLRQVSYADNLMSKEKYRSALEIYENIIFQCRGDTILEKVQYKLADCYFQQKLYADAIFEFEEFLRLFSVSKYSEDVDFKLGLCWFELSLSHHLDQTETKNAIKQFKNFLTKYPNSEKKENVKELLIKCENKLLDKKYENGHIYFMMGYYNAALMYLTEILDENTSGTIDRKTLILAAKIYSKKNDMSTLEKVYQTFKQKYPDNLEIEKIEQLLGK